MTARPQRKFPWTLVALVLVPVALIAPKAGDLILYYRTSSALGGACFGDDDCRDGACYQTDGVTIGGVCTRRCATDDACPAEFRCTPDSGVCLWRATLEYGAMCRDSSQCLGGFCAVFRDDGDLDRGKLYSASVCVERCDRGKCPAESACESGTCPDQSTCDDDGWCVPQQRVQRLLARRKQQSQMLDRAFDKDAPTHAE